MAQYDINLREYWRILKKKKLIVILTAIILGFFSTAFAVFSAPTPLYTSVCSIKFEKETPVEGLYARTISWSGGDDIETQLSVIQSYSVFQEVAFKMGLIPKRAAKNNHLKHNIISIIENLQSKVEVARESFTNILSIKVTDSNPVFAQELASTIALTYKELHSEQQLQRTTEAIKYIENQLRDVRQKLKESEDEFNRFSQENQLVSIDIQSENLLVRAQEIRNEIREIHEDKRELEGILGRLEQFLSKPSGSDNNFYSSKANSQYQATNDTLVEFFLKRDTLLEDYTDQHPEVIEIGRRIIENARKMRILLKLQVGDTGKKEIDLNQELEKVDKKTNVLMEKKLEFNRLKRKVELHNDMTALLERKNQEALIREAEKPEEITIVRPPLLSTTPINPPKAATTGAMGVIIGLILGMVAAFIVETFDTSLGAIEDVEETIGAKVLGVIPHADAKDVKEGLGEGYSEEIDESSLMQKIHLVSHFSPKSMIAESFRALRTNIQFKDAENSVKTVAITSASPQEGKTLVSINLAITMAQAGIKTLLIGSDMRKPIIARAFGVEMTPGLTDILLGNHPWRDTVKTVTDLIMGKMTLDEIMMTPGLDNLHIITSGSIPPNPAELIESKLLKDFIKEAKKEYDFILFDSPPILSTADAAILGVKMDGVLLLYRVGTVSRGLLKRSTTQLEQVRCNILGVIINGMKPEISPDFQDFKYFKYYYSYREEEKSKKRGEHKKGLTFFRKKKESGRALEKRVALKSAGKSAQHKQTKKGRMLRFFLILMALTFLAAGILWQNGIIDPLKLMNLEIPDKKENAVPIVKKKLSKKESKTAVNKRSKPKPISPEEDSTIHRKGFGDDTKPAVPRAQTTMKDKVDIQRAVSPEKIQSYPYSLYLGSFRTLDRTKRAISLYSKKGLSPYWVRVELKDKGVWFRVFIGYFKDRKEAENFAREHELTDATVKKTQYANLIGTYTSSDELEGKILSLKNLGYLPYVIKDHDSGYRLFIGALFTKSGAERLNNRLKSSGIQSQLVNR